MLKSGVYPASVTPFDVKGRIDMLSVAKLLAHFESTGCKGAVLAGTNGEGPSLSAVEKRDLIRDAVPLKGRLDLVLGIATPSLDEAVWLTKRAEEFGAIAALVMAPYYFKGVSDQAIVDWFLTLMDKSPSPILAYNFPKFTGVTITGEMMAKIGAHPKCAGCKDSSGEPGNLVAYRKAMTKEDQVLFVGNEALLIDALKAGWTGTISGAANLISHWLSAIVNDWFAGKKESAEAKFELAKPVIESIRQGPQPALNKSALAKFGVIDRSDVRLPLTEVKSEVALDLLSSIENQIGLPIWKRSPARLGTQ